MRADAGGGPTAERLSGTIAIARLLCVFGIIYVHAWTGQTGDQLRALAGTWQAVMRWTLMEFLGRSAVPLLGMVSGWLLANRRSALVYLPFLAGKARTILLPMILWNALSIVIVSGAGYAGIIPAPRLSSVTWLIDELFCFFTPNDINVQTAFLRDLFLCMVAAPLLLSARSIWLVGIAAGLAIWTASGWTSALLLRPSIPLFFIVGILIRRGDLAVRLATVSPVLAVAPALLIGAAKIAVEVQPDAALVRTPYLLPVVDLLLRPAAALLFWRAAWLLAGSRAAARLIALDPFTFFIFCAHLILIWIGGPLIGALTGPLGSPAYPLFLVLQPILVFAACIVIAQRLTRIAPGTANLLSGARLARHHGAARAKMSGQRIDCRP